jgi:hypothetical protein
VTASAYLWRRLDLDGRNFVRLDDGDGDGVSVQGDEICAEGDEHWAARFAITLDARWRHRRTSVEVIDAVGTRRLELTSSDNGKAWTRDGEPAPSLAGCTVVDLAGNPFTNAFVTRRFAPAVGVEIEVLAAYIETPALSVRPLPQRYQRLEEHRWAYSDDEYGRVEFSTDADGIVVEYEDLADRL